MKQVRQFVGRVASYYTMTSWAMTLKSGDAQSIYCALLALFGGSGADPRRSGVWTRSRFHQPRLYSRLVSRLRIVTSRGAMDITSPTVPYSLRKEFVMRTISPIRWGLRRRAGLRRLTARILSIISCSV